MHVLTQGLGTNQLPTWGFGDSITHADSPIVVNLSDGYWSYRNWGMFLWGNGATSNMDDEALPTGSFFAESVPGRGAAQDGAWTETGQDGAWTEPPPGGAYTQDNAYLKEFKPNTAGYTKEGVPVS